MAKIIMFISMLCSKTSSGILPGYFPFGDYQCTPNSKAIMSKTQKLLESLYFMSHLA